MNRFVVILILFFLTQNVFSQSEKFSGRFGVTAGTRLDMPDLDIFYFNPSISYRIKYNEFELSVPYFPFRSMRFRTTIGLELNYKFFPFKYDFPVKPFIIASTCYLYSKQWYYTSPKGYDEHSEYIYDYVYLWGGVGFQVTDKPGGFPVYLNVHALAGFQYRNPRGYSNPFNDYQFFHFNISYNIKIGYRF